MHVVCNSMGNEPAEGAITSVLNHLKGYYSKTRLFFLIFAGNVTLISWHIIDSIGGLNLKKYRKSAFSMELYEGDDTYEKDGLCPVGTEETILLYHSHLL